MTEYTGEEFRAPFCEALAKPGAVVEWESSHGNEWYSNESKYLPAFGSRYKYRFKLTPKRMVTMYDRHGKPHQLVAPEREAPKMGADYFFICEAPSTDERVRAARWDSYVFDFNRQRCNNVFLAREDAQAMADFQREQREGL